MVTQEPLTTADIDDNGRALEVSNVTSENAVADHFIDTAKICELPGCVGAVPVGDGPPLWSVADQAAQPERAAFEAGRDAHPIGPVSVGLRPSLGVRLACALSI